MRNSVTEQLNRARQLITAILQNVKVQQELSKQGIDTEHLVDMLNLYQTTYRLDSQQRTAYREKKQATKALQIARRKAQKIYKQHSTYRAKFLTESVHTISEPLHLQEQRPLSFLTWISEAQVFYHNAVENPKWQQVLTEAGLLPEAIHQGGRLIRRARQAYIAQISAISDAQRATRARNASLHLLNRQITALQRHVAQLLKTHPELGEELSLHDNRSLIIS